jgi:hypothetical protein
VEAARLRTEIKQAIPRVDRREEEGLVTTYTPKTIDTSHVQLTPDVEELVERLPENNHDLWAQKRIDEGWRYGPTRDDDAKEHPDLVPYDQLPE